MYIETVGKHAESDDFVFRYIFSQHVMRWAIVTHVENDKVLQKRNFDFRSPRPSIYISARRLRPVVDKTHQKNSNGPI
jgi:hypothetical protein